MNTTRMVSERNSNAKRTGRSYRWPATAVLVVLVLCVGISPLAAQTVTGSTRLTREAATTDPNTTANDPNQKAATDPNATAAIDPNQAAATDPNQTVTVDPNQVAVDPNRVVVEPNQVTVDPNQVVVEPNQVAGGAGAGQFNKSGNILIADRLNHRVIEVDRDIHEIVWQFGDGNSVAGPKSVVAPSDAERVGEWTLICGASVAMSTDPNAAKRLCDHRVLLADRSGKIFWQYGRAGVADSDEALNGSSFACRLENGNTLITDSGNNRILEVNRRGRKVMEFVTSKQSGSVADPLATRAVRLDNGNTLISDQFNHQVIEIDSDSNLVFTQGSIGAAGNGSHQLNSPCDAKVIGDYTGLTLPSLDSYCEWSGDPEPPPERDRYERDGRDQDRNRDWRR